MVLESAGAIGTETSSRNSEVIHAGIYYEPGSLRARLCVKGRDMLYDFAKENGVPFNNCGKLIVATRPEDAAQLDAIKQKADACGVTNLKRLSRSDVCTLEPDITCSSALLSPSTGIVDSHSLMVALEGQILNCGGQVVLHSQVASIAPSPAGEYVITVASDGETSSFTTRRIVNAAGLKATELGACLGSTKSGYEVPTMYPAKGHYFTVSGRTPFRHLIYPAPSGAWLGIHLTLDMGGAARFGPDIVWNSALNYDFEDEDRRRETFFSEIGRYWPEIENRQLHAGYVGVRPKIYAPGTPTADFAIHGETLHGWPNVVALYGIESPGLTSSLAIAEYVGGLFE